MGNRISPCYGCERRVPPDCHAVCEAYLKWASEREEMRNRAYAERVKEDKITGFMIEARKRNARIKRGEQ